MTPCQKLMILTRRPCDVGMRIHVCTLPASHLWGLWKIVAYSLTYLAGTSCINSFWHCVIPMSSTCLVSASLFMYAVKTPKVLPTTPMTAPMIAIATPTMMGVTVLLELLVDKVCLLPTEISPTILIINVCGLIVY